MQRLFPEKHVTIITSDVLEERLIEYIRARGASGYTIVRARGAGSSGEQSGALDIDTNIKIHIIIYFIYTVNNHQFDIIFTEYRISSGYIPINPKSSYLNYSLFTQ